jgi:hypothetical protein
MTEEDCKRVTEWLGECWHEWKVETGCVDVCLKCDSSKLFPWIKNRTFTDPADFFAVFEKIKHNHKFFEYLSIRGLAHIHYPASSCGEMKYSLSTECLSKTDTGHYRLCQLTAAWIKEKKQKGERR